MKVSPQFKYLADKARVKDMRTQDYISLKLAETNCQAEQRLVTWLW